MEMKTHKLGVAVLVTMSCLLPACAEYTEVPSRDFASLEPVSEHGYRITTVDNRVYVVRRLALQDRVLVVEALSEKQEPEQAVPFSIPFDTISRIERIDVDYIVPVVAAACVVAVVVAISQIKIGAP
jgi:hypothetical protein